ncbi:uncharacterized protein LOC113273324 [Papaver somniferum]|uniref:uncharacterized protein LOC113273324 n=1 Tax=Papaver somniferum TaxID=3469 RepID=UPI000E6F496E|nr:uncharacterized protein LOC113273324 [Papaver somniferum]
MSNLSKLEFVALNLSGENNLSWILDAKIHLNAMNLGNTIVEGNDEFLEDRSKAMIFLRCHLDEALKSQYLTVEDPFSLWYDLKDRYDHQKTVILPRTRHEWMNLCLQDFKTISEYNSELFRIVSRLRLCGEIVSEYEKTYSTFHASKVLLQQQYRERRFEKYSQLISCLLVAEQNNELLMRNHQFHPTGTAATPEVNVSSSRGRGKGHWLGPKRHINKKKGGHYSKKGNNNNHSQDKGKEKALPQRTKMGPQRRLGVYVGFDSPLIIRFLEPLTGDVFKARFADCHFDESNFTSLGGEKLKLEERREISWNTPYLSRLDPRTSECEI